MSIPLHTLTPEDGAHASGATIRAGTTRLFQPTQSPPAVSPAVRDRIDTFAAACASALCTETSLEGSGVATPPTRGLASERISLDPMAVTASALIVEWNARALLTFDRMLFFRLFDAMYGGDPLQRSSMPQRPLTAFETAVAMNLAETVLKTMCLTFSARAPLSMTDLASPHRLPPASSRAKPVDYVVFDVSLPATGDCLTVGLPASGLDALQDPPERVPRNLIDLDPSWTRGLRTAITHAAIEFIATTDAPDLELGDIAALQPGSLLEFDGACLNAVRLECADEAVFIGRLGRSKGFYTIGIDASAAPLLEKAVSRSE